MPSCFGGCLGRVGPHAKGKGKGKGKFAFGSKGVPRPLFTPSRPAFSTHFPTSASRPGCPTRPTMIGAGGPSAAAGPKLEESKEIEVKEADGDEVTSMDDGNNVANFLKGAPLPGNTWATGDTGDDTDDEAKILPATRTKVPPPWRRQPRQGEDFLLHDSGGDGEDGPDAKRLRHSLPQTRERLLKAGLGSLDSGGSNKPSQADAGILTGVLSKPNFAPDHSEPVSKEDNDETEPVVKKTRVSLLLAGLPAPRAGGGDQTMLSDASEDKPRLSPLLAGLLAPRAASNEQVSVKEDKPETAVPSVSLAAQPQDSTKRDSAKSEPSMEDKPAILVAVSASLPASAPAGNEFDPPDPKEEKLQATGLLLTSSAAPVSDEKVEPETKNDDLDDPNEDEPAG